MDRITAWHGSSHDFDRFDDAMRGSGNGAADYGVGIYVAEARGVARQYTPDGGGIVPTFYEVRGVRTRRGTPEQKAADLVHGLGVARARKTAREWLAAAEAGEEWTAAQGAGYYRAVLAFAEDIKSAREVREAKGHLYEVTVPTDGWLDWDRPLSEQPEAYAAFDDAGFDPGLDATGAEAYRALAAALGSPAKASAALLEAGLAGIAYLDGNSRSSGRGTRNRVVFAARDIEIVSKDGTPVARREEPSPGRRP
jgi:hypothetical protein